ncbi:MAG: hypothetical protein SNJ72_03955, partial [Fimbriimonadales bacterium]
GGGGNGAPSGSFNISGTVQLPNSPTLAPFADATVQVYLFPEMTLLPISTRTDSQGRYSLQVPATYAGRDLVIIAEKVRNGQRVRAMTFSINTPIEGVTGADLDPFTTFAAAELIRHALENNLSDLVPNGFAELVRQTREALADAENLTPILGQTLSEQWAEGVLSEAIAEPVRTWIAQHKQNFEPPQGDVAVAKSMMQMLRDTSVLAFNIGDSETFRLEEDLRALEQEIEERVITPLDNVNGRGLQYLLTVMSEDEFRYPPLIGREPGRYEHYQSNNQTLIRRIGNTDDRTWEIVNNIPNDRFQGLTARITTQNALQELELTADAGRYTGQVRKAGDPSLQHDAVLEVLRKDSEGRPTQLRATITLRDSQLRQPIQFSGTLNLTPRDGDEGLSFRELAFTGSFTSQYGELNVSNLTQAVTETQNGEQVQVRANSLLVVLDTNPATSIEIRDLSLQYTDEGEGGMAPAELQAQAIRVRARNTTMNLSSVRMRLVPNQTDNQDYPALIAGQLEYRSPKLTLTGTLNATWDNASTASRNGDDEWVPLSKFPSGQIVLSNGSATPTVGRPIGLSFELRFEPNAPTPQVRLQNLRITLGSEAMQGTITAPINVRQDGRFNKRQLFRDAQLAMTHTPSNFRLLVSGQGVLGEDNFSGEIRKPDNTRIAQIGKASSLGLSELGNLVIVKYNDNSFESLQSLLPSR